MHPGKMWERAIGNSRSEASYSERSIPGNPPNNGCYPMMQRFTVDRATSFAFHAHLLYLFVSLLRSRHCSRDAFRASTSSAIGDGGTMTIER